MFSETFDKGGGKVTFFCICYCFKEGRDKKLTSVFLGYSITQAVSGCVMYDPAFILITASTVVDKKFLSPLIFQFRIVVNINWEKAK